MYLSKEEKENEKQYSCERCENLSEKEKQKLVEYRKKYYKIRKKKPHYSHKKLFSFGKNDFSFRFGLGEWSSVRNFIWYFFVILEYKGV